MKQTREENPVARDEIAGSHYQSDIIPSRLIRFFSAGKMAVLLNGSISDVCNLQLFASLLAGCPAPELCQTRKIKLQKSLSCQYRSSKILLSHFCIGNYFPSSKDERGVSITSATLWSGRPVSNLLTAYKHTERERPRMIETYETQKMFQSPTLQYSTIHNLKHNSLRNYGAQQSCGASEARYSFEGL